MPRAWDFPFINFQTRNVPSTWNPLGIKGAGEAGTIGSAPAVMNAAQEALSRPCLGGGRDGAASARGRAPAVMSAGQDALSRAFKVGHIDMPATPRRIWETIQSAQAA